MMQRTPLQRKTPLLARVPMKPGKPLKTNQSANSRYGKSHVGKGLAQRIAESLGLAFKHQHSEPSVFRSETHRRNVAAMACICCGIEKRSQAAHLNLLGLGKGRGLKVSDAFTVPLCCTTLGSIGCHVRLDSSGVYDKATSEALQMTWLHQTRDQLICLGQWEPEAEADMIRIVDAYLKRAA